MSFKNFTLSKKLNLLMTEGKFLTSVIHRGRRINLYQLNAEHYETIYNESGDYIETIREMTDRTAFEEYFQKKVLPDTLPLLLDEAIAKLNADKGNVQYYDTEAKCLRIAVYKGFSREFLDHFAEVKSTSASVCSRAYTSGAPFVSQDVESDADFIPHLSIARNENFRSVISVPLVFEEQIVGMVSLHHHLPGWDWNINQLNHITPQLVSILKTYIR